ncbi:MAG: HAD-IIA family hydrolase [Rhodobacteraceae bacterium]|nr:HAD-IIA family hydrolase [Paracoccaceae bacterium]
MTPGEAFARYEAIRDRLPKGRDFGRAVQVAGLEEVADQIDVFVFDAFGVLNVGERPIEGATECVARLREAGKQVFVLTNAASFPQSETQAKFRRLGFDFSPYEIISSRDACETHLSRHADVALWGVAAAPEFQPCELSVQSVPLNSDPAAYEDVDGILLLSSASWDRGQQDMLLDALGRRPRPVVVANPDLVAPRETGLTLEPGYFAHDLQDALGIEVEYHGKPFPSVFEMVEARVPGVAPERIAMVGDTLHTDVLGAKARGWKAVLISDHGLFAGLDVRGFIDRSGLSPDWVAPSI